MKQIDNFLNNITMYRLVLYILIIWVVVAALLSFVGILSYDGILLLVTSAFLVVVSWTTNFIFAKVFNTPTNIESIYISAMILTLIISPIKSVDDLALLFWAAVWTAASKFIFAFHNKHLFNPVAFAVALTSYAIGESANWWVGTQAMLPFVLIGGLLIVRKIRRFDLVFYFFLISTLTILCLSFARGSNPLSTIYKTFVDSPILFFAFIMLTEPLTTPPTKKLQSLYGAIVGFLFAPQLHFGSLNTTPETALLVGNLFSYMVSPKEKLILKLKEKIQLAPDIFDFVFNSKHKLKFEPGQYLEWTIGESHADSRGNRRYFTIASSPTEPEIRMGIKIYEKSSSFKKNLLDLDEKNHIMAGQLAGDFTLPKNENKKLVFLAGGIGITPFRSMIKYMIDTNEKRDLILFYANRNPEDIVYKDVFNEAWSKLEIKTVYTLTNKSKIPSGWNGETGYVDEEMVKKYIPNYKERTYYISGPLNMINGFKETLKNLGVSDSAIKTDFFPGFA